MFDFVHAGLGTSFARSWLSWKIDGANHPFSASFAVTNACNLRCSYCACPSLSKKQLDLEQITRLFAVLRGLGVRRLGLLGGEPMLRKDLPSVISLAKANDFFVSVNTNLTLYGDFPQRLQGADLVMTSLDGSRRAHERNRGAGSWDGVLDAIAALRQKRTKVIVIAVINQHSITELPALLVMARQYEFQVHLQPQCNDTEIVQGSQNASNELLRTFWRKALYLKKAGEPIASSKKYLETLIAWEDFQKPTIKKDETRCAAGTGFLFVDPQGNGWPCAWTKRKVEPVNLLSGDWRHIKPKLPCNDCLVGPLLEFNLLYRYPLSGLRSALKSYYSA